MHLTDLPRRFPSLEHLSTFLGLAPAWHLFTCDDDDCAHGMCSWELPELEDEDVAA
jgi:hypothetical protein